MIVPESISAVLPAFNEQACIVEIVHRTDRALRESAVRTHEVIVVDDGSRDGTAKVLAGLETEIASLRVIRHARNQGYGSALRSGFHAAAYGSIWLLDADGQFDPGDLRLLLDRYQPDSFVLGRRVCRKDSWARSLAAKAFFGVARLVLGEPIPDDVDCGFKLFPRAVGQGLSAQGAMISTELLLNALSAGCRLKRVAVPHHPRLTGRPTGARPQVVVTAFAELWRLRREKARLSRRPC